MRSAVPLQQRLSSSNVSVGNARAVERAGHVGHRTTHPTRPMSVLQACESTHVDCMMETDDVLRRERSVLKLRAVVNLACGSGCRCSASKTRPSALRPSVASSSLSLPAPNPQLLWAFAR
eukprot:655129-Rhodomonas_salina.2